MSLRFISENANRALVWKLFAGAVVLLGIGSGCQTTTETGTPLGSRVVRIGGKHNARMSTDNLTWQPLKVGGILRPGVMIQTDVSSYVDIVLGETDNLMPQLRAGQRYYYAERPGNWVRLKQDSALRFNHVVRRNTGSGSAEDIQLSLERGKVLGRRLRPVIKSDSRMAQPV